MIFEKDIDIKKLNKGLDLIPKTPCSYSTQNISCYGQEVNTIEEFSCNNCGSKEFGVFFPGEAEDYSVFVRCKNCGTWYCL